MLQTILAAACATLLIGAASLAARRWGVRVGGVVSAFPAIVGPVLVLVTVAHGAAAAARSADGTLLGLAGLAAFSAAYGRASTRRAWPVSLLCGWVAAAGACLLAGTTGGSKGPLIGLLAAGLTLSLAHRALPAPASALPAARRETSIPGRMALTALVVLALAFAVDVLGPFAGGILASLPVLASVLAVTTHRDAGPGAAVVLLRGTLAGMGGFVAFCAAVALLIGDVAPVSTFAAATVAALLAQVPALRGRPEPASA